MRYKVGPPARDRDFLLAVRDALPLVPGSEDDCCTRIRDATAVASRADAREWLTFCLALGLVEETDAGFHRLREEPTADELADRLVGGVFPARELLATLEDEGPLDSDDAFEALRDRIPRWERSRTADWEAEWRERVAYLLGWCLELGLVERVDEGYRAARSED